MRAGRVSVSELLPVAIPIVGLLAALLGVIWSMLNRRIDEMKKTMDANVAELYELAREERKETTTIFAKDRERLDAFQREIFDKMESLLMQVTTLTAKIERD